MPEQMSSEKRELYRETRKKMLLGEALHIEEQFAALYRQEFPQECNEIDTELRKEIEDARP